MFTTDNCCCCFSLRTGCLIIGYLQLIFPALNLVILIVSKANGIDSAAQDSISNTVSNTSGTAFWVSVWYNAHHVMFAILLLYGLMANRKKYVFYYLCASVALIVARIILLIVLFIMAVYISVPLTIAFNFFSWAILLYALLVVFSYYKEMGSSNTAL